MQHKKERITLTIPSEVMRRIESAAERYCIPKTAFIIQATVEKLEALEISKEN